MSKDPRVGVDVCLGLGAWKDRSCVLSTRYDVEMLYKSAYKGFQAIVVLFAGNSGVKLWSSFWLAAGEFPTALKEHVGRVGRAVSTLFMLTL